MEQLAGFEKTESGLRYQFIQRGEGKMAEGTAAVHYEGSLESESFDLFLSKKNQSNLN
jgi:peptidyl-prolyl cis-trans isomerase A (cyclophilin A)